MGQRKRYRRASSAVSSVDLTGALSPASSPPPTVDDPCSKKSKFEKRFNTATTSNEDVLSKSLQYLFIHDSTDRENRKAIEFVDL